MDEVWERAVEAALEEQESSPGAPRTLTLDGAVKCVQGRLPPPELLERFQSLELLSIANVGVSSLDKFPRLRKLQRLILSDNRIAGGLEFLVEAGLESLRDLDLSNNRIHNLEDLAPLAQLRLVSLDLYECPVTRIKDYRSRVFGMILSLKYLDKMDADENERPESDDEEEDEDEDEDDDPASCEVEREERAGKLANGGRMVQRDEGIIDAEDEEESDADEEMDDGLRPEANGYHLNGFRVAAAAAVGVDDDEEDVEDEYDDDLGEEVDGEESDDDDDDDVVEAHEIGDSGEDEGDVVEDDEEDVEDDGDGKPGSSGGIGRSDGEIDAHEQGEDAEDDENGEIGEEDEQEDVQEIAEVGEFDEDDGDGDDEEDGAEYLIQPIAQVDNANGGCNFETHNEGNGNEDGVDDDNHPVSNGVLQGPASSSHTIKRKRDADDKSIKNLRSSRQR